MLSPFHPSDKTKDINSQRWKQLATNSSLSQAEQVLTIKTILDPHWHSGIQKNLICKLYQPAFVCHLLDSPFVTVPQIHDVFLFSFSNSLLLFVEDASSEFERDCSEDCWFLGCIHVHVGC